MSTIRLTVTSDLKKEIDFLRLMEYPTLTDAEIVKVAVGAQAVKSRRKRVFDYDDSDPAPEELMLQAARSFELEDGDGDGDEEVFWDETKLKPLKLKNYV